jgi:hypothetical protein
MSLIWVYGHVVTNGIYDYKCSYICSHKTKVSHSDLSKFILVEAFCQLHFVNLMSVFYQRLQGMMKGMWRDDKSDGGGDKGDERMLRDDKKWWWGSK